MKTDQMQDNEKTEKVENTTSSTPTTTSAYDPKRQSFFIRLFFIVFSVTMLLFAVVLINNYVLPSKGLYFNTNNRGQSMYPTLRDGALLLCAKDSAAPFEKLEVGDIVVCMRRTSQTGMNFVITDNGIVGSGSYTITPGYAGKDDRDAYYKEDENAVYDPNQIYVHRIVEINEVGDRVLFTRGDNNPDDDSINCLSFFIHRYFLLFTCLS